MVFVDYFERTNYFCNFGCKGKTKVYSVIRDSYCNPSICTLLLLCNSLVFLIFFSLISEWNDKMFSCLWNIIFLIHYMLYCFDPKFHIFIRTLCAYWIISFIVRYDFNPRCTRIIWVDYLIYFVRYHFLLPLFIKTYDVMTQCP